MPKPTFGFIQFMVTKVSTRLLLKRKLTDGTWSKIGITEAKEFINLFPKYPLKYQFQNEYSVLKDVIINWEELQKSNFELDDIRGFISVT